MRSGVRKRAPLKACLHNQKFIQRLLVLKRLVESYEPVVALFPHHGAIKSAPAQYLSHLPRVAHLVFNVHLLPNVNAQRAA